MKKFLPIVFAIFFLMSCETDPNLDKIQDQVVTYTQYDKNADFSSASTFYIPDSILLISKKPDPTYLTDKTSTDILDFFVSQMLLRGYTQVDTKEEADFGVQMSYIETTYYFTDYDEYWWTGYPGYWNPSYWNPAWTNWYYPYVSIFSYTDGSLLTEIIDLRAPKGNKLPVVWDSYITGLATISNAQTLINAKKGIEQSFVQSPYLESSQNN